MSEMVDTIARAIEEKSAYMLSEHTAKTLARAALQALRKPTAAMLAAQDSAYPGAPAGALENLWWLAIDEALR